MLFSVIYEANYPVPDAGIRRGYGGQTYIEDVAPPHRRKLWELTEARDEDAYWDSSQKWRHRKWAAVLTRDQFDEFIRTTWLSADETETMGSIGAPGFGFGWAPAISFSYDADGVMLNAYVTPVPEVKGEARPDLLAKHQERVFSAVRSFYGDGWDDFMFGPRPAPPTTDPLHHRL